MKLRIHTATLKQRIHIYRIMRSKERKRERRSNNGKYRKEVTVESQLRIKSPYGRGKES